MLFRSLGCGRGTTVTDAEGTQTTVTERGDGVEMTVTGEDGQTLKFAGDEAGVPLPDGFPSDVPIYAGATVVASMTLPGGMNVTLKTGDPQEKVRAYYETQLKANGWEVQATMNTADGAMLQTQKENRSVNVVIGRDEATTIHLTVTQQDP